MFIKKQDSKVAKLGRDSSSNSISQQVNDEVKVATGIKDDGVYIRPSKSNSSGKQRRPVSAPVIVKNVDNNSAKVRNKPKSIAIESKTSSKVITKTPTDEVMPRSPKVEGNKTPTTPTDAPDLAMFTTDV